MTEKILLKNIHYLNEAFEVDRGSIIIEDGIIKQIHKGELSRIEHKKLASFNIIDGKNLFCTPGLINAHVHPSKDIYQGCSLGSDLPELLSKIHSQNRKESDEDQYLASLYCMKRMLQKGVTTLGVFTSRYKPDLRALNDSGMRSLLTFIVNENWHGDGVSPDVIDVELLPKIIDEFLKSRKNETVSLGIGTASEVTASRDFIKRLHDLAHENDIIFSLHSAEGKTQWIKSKEIHGLSSIEMLDNINVLDDNTLLIHCSYLSTEEISILNKYSLGLVYCPIANAFAKSSLFNLDELKEGLCKIGIGTDSAMLNPTNNLINDASFAYFSQRLKESGNDISANQILKMLTHGGAEALGINNLGVIKEGYIADLAIFSAHQSLSIDICHPFNLLNDMVKSENAKYIIIDGRLIIDDGNFVYLDAKKISEEFKGVKDRVLPSFLNNN
jgi:5-methylthioadenosine/S-adenosylhomocysteine deaminase